MGIFFYKYILYIYLVFLLVCADFSKYDMKRLHSGSPPSIIARSEESLKGDNFLSAFKT